MTRLSAGDAALFGLKALQRDPLMFVLFAALSVGIYVALSLTLGQGLSEAMASYMTALETMQGNGDPTAVMAALGELAGHPFVFISTMAQILIGILFQAAVLRVLVRNEPRGFSNISLWYDEIRVFVAALIVWLLVMGSMVLGSVVTGVVSGLAGQASPGIAVAVGFLLGFATLGLTIYVGVRLSPAAAASVRDEGFYIFRGLSISSGRFWSLFGAFVLAIFIAILFGLILFILQLAVGTLLGANPMAMDPTSLDFTSPGYIATQAISQVGNLILATLFIGVPAYYAAHLAGVGTPNDRVPQTYSDES